MSDNSESAHQNCQEFGHIHLYKLHQGPRALDGQNLISRASQKSTDDEDEDCHEGKSVMSYSPFPAIVINFVIPKFKLSFVPIYSLENRFKSPDLEPRRKPPRFA